MLTPIGHLNYFGWTITTLCLTIEVRFQKMYGFSIAIFIDSLIITEDCKCVQTHARPPLVPLRITEALLKMNCHSFAIWLTGKSKVVYASALTNTYFLQNDTAELFSNLTLSHFDSTYILFRSISNSHNSVMSREFFSYFVFFLIFHAVKPMQPMFFFAAKCHYFCKSNLWTNPRARILYHYHYLCIQVMILHVGI